MPELQEDTASHQLQDVHFLVHFNIYEIGIPLGTDGMLECHWQRFFLSYSYIK